MIGKKKLGLIIMCMMLMIMPGLKTRAADHKEVTGTLKYDYAFEVLNLVNAERQKGGVSALSMDKSMLDSAMARAAETTVSFSHTRPNGSMCFSFNSKVYGENIAYGQSSPKDVMRSWMNSQGHKANIMNSSYKSIGIGCFKSGNTLYWVQVFGFDDAESVSCPKNTSAKYKVSLNSNEETKLVGTEKEDVSTEKEKTTTEKANEVSEKEDAAADDVFNDFSNTKQDKVKGLKTNSKKKKIKMSWKDNSEADGYQIQISANKKYKNAENYVTGSKTKLNIRYMNGKKLKSNKKYYVRIRSFSYNDEVLVFSEWKATSVRVK